MLYGFEPDSQGRSGSKSKRAYCLVGWLFLVITRDMHPMPRLSYGAVRLVILRFGGKTITWPFLIFLSFVFVTRLSESGCYGHS